MRKWLRSRLLDVLGAVMYAEAETIEVDPVDGFRAFRTGRVRYYVLHIRIPRFVWNGVVLRLLDAAERV